MLDEHERGSALLMWAAHGMIVEMQKLNSFKLLPIYVSL